MPFYRATAENRNRRPTRAFASWSSRRITEEACALTPPERR